MRGAVLTGLGWPRHLLHRPSTSAGAGSHHVVCQPSLSFSPWPCKKQAHTASWSLGLASPWHLSLHIVRPAHVRARKQTAPRAGQGSAGAGMERVWAASSWTGYTQKLSKTFVQRTKVGWSGAQVCLLRARCERGQEPGSWRAPSTSNRIKSPWEMSLHKTTDRFNPTSLLLMRWPKTEDSYYGVKKSLYLCPLISNFVFLLWESSQSSNLHILNLSSDFWDPQTVAGFHQLSAEGFSFRSGMLASVRALKITPPSASH